MKETLSSDPNATPGVSYERGFSAPNQAPSRQVEASRPLGLLEQIRLAQKSMAEWPQWMKDTAYFAGSNEVDNVD